MGLYNCQVTDYDNYRLQGYFCCNVKKSKFEYINLITTDKNIKNHKIIRSQP